MCGRSALVRSGAQVQQSVRAVHFHESQRYQPSFNIGPMRFQPVLIRDNETGQRVLMAMRWGLVPFYTKKEPDYGSLIKTINARDDSLTGNKPMFSHIKKTRRCVVVADGFYEWLRDSNPRQPYFVKFPGDKILTMAGLYDIWKNAEGEVLYTYTVVTTNPSSSLSFLHDRMPLILDSDEDIDRWLNVEIPFEEVKSLLRPYEGTLEIFPVSTFVNKIGHDSEECVKPITKKLEAQKITNFFAKKPAIKKRSPEEEEEEDNEHQEKKVKLESGAEHQQSHIKEEEKDIKDNVKEEAAKETKDIKEEPLSEEDKASAIEILVSLGLKAEDAKEAIEKYGSVEVALNHY
jgi:putative SOS response-associated peptidase YedK